MFSEIQKVYEEKGINIIGENNFDDIFNSLIQNLGSADSDIREGSLDILWELIDSGELPTKRMIGMGSQLADHLSTGIGEKENDTVFLRTFSALLVGALAVQDEMQQAQGKSFLSEKDFSDWFEKSKAYVLAEQDFRSFVPGKGWAHSISHGADLMRDFAFHRFTTAKDHIEILDILSDKLIENHEEIYINNDDNRMARVVMTIMLRDELNISDYEQWLNGLLKRFDGKSLLDYAGEREKVVPWFNTISFLRALYFVLLNGMKVLQEGSIYENEPVLRNKMMSLLLDMLQKMDNGLNYRR